MNTRAYGPWFQMMAGESAQSDEQLGRRDIGFLNLQAAIGLPAADGLDTGAYVRKLNLWARQVQKYTTDHWRLFQRSPESYGNSSDQFRMMALVTVLQRQLGVHYNLSFSEGDYNATDSRNLFIHGILAGHGGTCVTMPVLYIAIGRRLGYPLHLAQAKEHLFARWEEPGGERFNIECTSRGFRAIDDDYFCRWPKPLSADELPTGSYLRNLRPREELALFLCERARCCMDNLRPGEALLSTFLAAQLAPQNAHVMSNWSVATVMAGSLLEARRKARLRRYDELDLPSVYVPNGVSPFDRWAAPVVRDALKRIAKIRNHPRADNRGPAPVASGQLGGTIIVGSGF